MPRTQYGIDSAGLDLARGIEFQCQLTEEQVLSLANIAMAETLAPGRDLSAYQFSVTGRLWGTKKFNPEKPRTDRDILLARDSATAEIYVGEADELKLPVLDSWGVEVKYKQEGQLKINEFSIAFGGLLKLTDYKPYAKYAHLLEKRSPDAYLDITVHEEPFRRTSLRASMDFAHLINA